MALCSRSHRRCRSDLRKACSSRKPFYSRDGIVHLPTLGHSVHSCSLPVSSRIALVPLSLSPQWSNPMHSIKQTPSPLRRGSSIYGFPFRKGNGRHPIFSLLLSDQQVVDIALPPRHASSPDASLVYPRRLRIAGFRPDASFPLSTVDLVDRPSPQPQHFVFKGLHHRHSLNFKIPIQLINPPFPPH